MIAPTPDRTLRVRDPSVPGHCRRSYPSRTLWFSQVPKTWQSHDGRRRSPRGDRQPAARPAWAAGLPLRLNLLNAAPRWPAAPAAPHVSPRSWHHVDQTCGPTCRFGNTLLWERLIREAANRSAVPSSRISGSDADSGRGDARQRRMSYYVIDYPGYAMRITWWPEASRRECAIRETASAGADSVNR